MTGKILYPKIVYFELAKDFLTAKAGDPVTISDSDGSECLYIGNDIKLSIDMAIKCPEYFIAVDEEEHAERCKRSAIRHFMNKGKTYEKAQELYEKM